MSMGTPDVEKTVVGKIGNVYVVDHGTTAPFTIPPDATVDVDTALSAAWLAGNLGYLHEEDTPTFKQDRSNERISAWQRAGGLLRNLLTEKINSVTFTCREWNRGTWALLEPGTTYTTGANGTVSLSIPGTTTNSPKAALFEIQDIDFGTKIRWYVPRVTVSEVGDLKFVGNDTGNSQVTFEFEEDVSGNPLYYIATNHLGMVTA
jgi:hypothetical protein